jgi:hypothetical protein
MWVPTAPKADKPLGGWPLPVPQAACSQALAPDGAWKFCFVGDVELSAAGIIPGTYSCSAAPLHFLMVGGRHLLQTLTSAVKHQLRAKVPVPPRATAPVTEMVAPRLFLQK